METPSTPTATTETAAVTRYKIPERVQQQIESNFTHHPPKGDQAQRYERLRAAAKTLAVEIAESTPPSREQALALTNLEQACFWTNAAIARNE